MGCHVRPCISVLVPARNEERTLHATLPAILTAARELPQPAEVLVIMPPTSPFLANPPTDDPQLSWHGTPRPGKFNALRAGADLARGQILILVDADVLVEPDTFRFLAQPILDGFADVVTGSIELLPRAANAQQRLLERWATTSFRCWEELRANHPDLLWALPGAIYGIRRDLFPRRPLVPIIDDASVGLHAKEAGSAFVHAPGATVRTSAPANYWHWARQKLRSRRGWAALALLRPDEVSELEMTFRQYLTSAADGGATSRLMYAQDSLLRFAARQLVRFERSPSGSWKPARRRDQWPGPAHADKGVSRPDDVLAPQAARARTK
jgi:cellulose synthase/poly-beta-1,6-N-acetylglucosamine synthase-like glycosyltransferase